LHPILIPTPRNARVPAVQRHGRPRVGMFVPEDSVPTTGALPAVGLPSAISPGDLYGSGPPAAMAHS